MAQTTENDTITDFTQFNWDKSKDYYSGRLTKPVIPHFKSQDDVEMYMGSLFSQFNDKDQDIQRFPIPSFGNQVKEELDRKYRYDMIEKAKHIDKLFMERKRRKMKGKMANTTIKSGGDEDTIRFD